MNPKDDRSNAGDEGRDDETEDGRKDDRPNAENEGADDQGKEDWNPLGLEITPSAAAVNLSWLPKPYREAVTRLQRNFKADYAAFENTALDLIARHGSTSGDDVNAAMRAENGFKRDHYCRVILARVFRHRHGSKSEAMRSRRGKVDRCSDKFWSDLFDS